MPENYDVRDPIEQKPKPADKPEDVVRITDPKMPGPGDQPGGPTEPGQPGAPVLPGQPAPGQPGYVAPGTPGELGGDESTVIDQMLGAYGEDIDYLRGEPYSTTQEQAMREREKFRVRNEYDTMRQNLIDTLGAQQGFSGVLAGKLYELEGDQARTMSNIDRDIFVKAADEMRSRRGESRNILGGLESLERERFREGAGYDERLDESERRRLLDLMGAVGLGPRASDYSFSDLISASAPRNGGGDEDDSGMWGSLASMMYGMGR